MEGGICRVITWLSMYVWQTIHTLSLFLFFFSASFFAISSSLAYSSLAMSSDSLQTENTTFKALLHIDLQFNNSSKKCMHNVFNLLFLRFLLRHLFFLGVLLPGDVLTLLCSRHYSTSICNSTILQRNVCIMFSTFSTAARSSTTSRVFQIAISVCLRNRRSALSQLIACKQRQPLLGTWKHVKVHV